MKNNNVEKHDEEINKKTADDDKLELFDWLQCFVYALVIGILIFIFVGRIVTVVGSSMYPTLYNGDRLIASDLFYTPENGDIVVIQTDSFSSDPIVKRVIATEGQTVNINFETGEVLVDGVVIDEPYISELTADQIDFDGEVTVPEGCMFLMGDNRNASTDSRDNRIGMVDERCIIGKVYFLIFPGENEYGEREFSRIGSVY